MYKSGEVINLVIQELGGKVTRQPGPIPGINTKITSFLDPDGWKTVSFFSMNNPISYDYCCMESSVPLCLLVSTRYDKGRGMEYVFDFLIFNNV